MTQWTNPAKAALENHLAQLRQALTASGADTDEVIDDLRRHIDEEVAALNLPVVNEDDIRRILQRLGTPEPADSNPEKETASVAGAEPASGRKPLKPPGWWLLTLGVILPVITLGFEFLTGACAGVLFDPLPNLGHVLLVAWVPLANLWLWVALRRGDLRRLAWLGLANAASIGVALVYALLFLPVTPFAMLGVIVYGFGLIPLTPLLSLIATLVLRGKLRRKAAGAGMRLAGPWLGSALGMGLVVLCSLPFLLTEWGLQMAASDDPGESARGVQMLRTFGNENRMLRACYGRAGRAGGIYSKPLNPEAARAVYYRVTGQAFNAVPPPTLYAGRAHWDALEAEFTWDDDQGGDAVAGRVKGLSLVASRQDGIVEPDAALAYVEWTLEFKNDSPLQREARAQIALPPGGVVSRLTLWIDGEEREAAFAGRAQVKAAYKEVVKRRRDPVLVTTCGPDRVLLQCFPVPPGGGLMKVRLGITAPLVLTNADAGFIRWPCLLERNFSLAPEFRHSLWLESSQPLAVTQPGLTVEQSKIKNHAVRGQVSDRELGSSATAIRARRDGKVRQVSTVDTLSADKQIIRQTVTETASQPAQNVVVVVDGTRGMERSLPAVAEALSKLPEGIEFSLLFAADGCQPLSGPIRKGDAALYRKAASALESARCAGGQDNVPALVQAWDIAATNGAGVIIWVHGPQPVLVRSAEELVQRFERRPDNPRLLEIQTRPGPNRLTEKLDGIAAVQSVPRLGDLRSDLERVFAGLSGKDKEIKLVRERLDASPAGTSAAGSRGSLHLARLWAAEEVQRLRAGRKFQEAAQLAARHQLVTPVSGAVVLETQQQYAQAGLQPADAATVPIIPEPSTWALMVLAFLLGGPALLRTRRSRK